MSSNEVTRHELAGYLAWAAYMTHNLLDGVDLRLTDEEKKRLSKQAQEYEKIGAKYVIQRR